MSPGGGPASSGYDRRMSGSILVVGAGCVGQVFGHHLARGGATVSVFVRDQYREAAQRGFPLHRLSMLRRAPTPARFDPVEVLSTIRAVGDRRFDQVYLTVPSTALSGTWLPELVAVIGDAVLVSLQPGSEDLQRIVDAGAVTTTLVAGSIGLLAYSAPLPGETRFAAPGTAYWTPPFARSFFSGAPGQVGRVVAALRRGGLPAGAMCDVHRAMALPNAIGMTFLLALEAAGWSEHALYLGPLMQRYREAVREVASIMGRSERRTLHGVGLARSAWLVHAGFTLARWLTPLPLELYLQRHFTKVGRQTRQMIGALIAQGERSSLPTGALAGLLGSADEARRAANAS